MTNFSTRRVSSHSLGSQTIENSSHDRNYFCWENRMRKKSKEKQEVNCLRVVCTTMLHTSVRPFLLGYCLCHWCDSKKKTYPSAQSEFRISSEQIGREESLLLYKFRIFSVCAAFHHENSQYNNFVFRDWRWLADFFLFFFSFKLIFV